jgi:signal transduction histidine kinase/type II secretory pathway pseudopilin PulG
MKNEKPETGNGKPEMRNWASHFSPNSLRFRLLMTMSIVVLVAVGVIAFLTSNSTTNEFQRYVQVDTQRNQQLVSDFLTAYQSDPSTQNLQTIVKNMADKSSDRFVVVDSTGYVIADSDGKLVGQTIPRQGPPPNFVYSSGGVTGVVTSSTEGFNDGISFPGPFPFTATESITGSVGVAVVPISNTLGERAGRLFGFGFIPLVVIPPAGSGTATGVESPGQPTSGEHDAKASLIVARLPRREGNPNQAGFLDSVNKELLIAMAVAGLVALLLTWLLSRRILGPVEALTAAAGRMEKGDLSQHVEVKSRDEIGKLAHAFNSMTDGLSRLEQLRRNMVTDVAHELRTPIANIRGYLEAMQDGIVKPDPNIIESLHEEAMLLTRLVEDLQELELAEAGKLKLVPQRVEPADVIEKAVTATQPAAAEKEISLKAELPSNLPEIDADPERIGQVLRNLLNNAIKHTPTGGRVDVAACTRGSVIEVSVKDSGPGISPDHLPHIFDRFYRADQSRARSTGGTGLGLAIVKELVEMHGGQVRAESTPGHGAAFYFTLPMRAPVS